MKTIKILLVAGARPNFMKVAPIIRELEKKSKRFNGAVGKLKYALVHTGQHYDFSMSETFLKDLEIRKPKFSLCVGSASHAVQTARVMMRFEKVMSAYKPDLVMVVGDVNSSLACALVASKMQYKTSNNAGRPLVAHVEAGLRSFDKTMPEEIDIPQTINP